MRVQAFAPQLAVERFDECIVRGLSRPGEVRRDALLLSPQNHIAQDEFAAITPSECAMERLIRSLKEQCVHRQRFESQARASRAIGDWIQFHNHKRPHQALDMKTPTETFILAA